MPKPVFTPDPQNVKMGPAIVVFDGKVLGYTMNDSVNINYNMSTTPIQPDQASIPIAEYVTGVEASVDVMLAEVSNETMKLVPGADENGWRDPTGTNLLTQGKRLILYPLESGDNRVFNFDKACPIMNGAINFAREGVQNLPLQFKVFLESAGSYIMRFSE